MKTYSNGAEFKFVYYLGQTGSWTSWLATKGLVEFLTRAVLKPLERVYKVTVIGYKIYDVAPKGLIDILEPTECHSPRPSLSNYLSAFSEVIFPSICFWANAVVPAQ